LINGNSEDGTMSMTWTATATREGNAVVIYQGPL
jgi:hypothetical protein